MWYRTASQMNRITPTVSLVILMGKGVVLDPDIIVGHKASGLEPWIDRRKEKNMVTSLGISHQNSAYAKGQTGAVAAAVPQSETALTCYSSLSPWSTPNQREKEVWAGKLRSHHNHSYKEHWIKDPWEQLTKSRNSQCPPWPPASCPAQPRQ